MKLCPITGQVCELTGCPPDGCALGVAGTPDKRMPNTPLQGWECPRCKKIHSPFTLHCDCPPKVNTKTQRNTNDWFENHVQET